MLKKLFHGGQPNDNSSSASLTDARNSELEKDVWDERTGYAQSVAQLDQFEARLRETLRILTRHCQTLTEFCTSTSALTEHLPQVFPDAVSRSNTTPSRRQNDEALGLVSMFRVSAIAPLQSLLILVPQLRVRCEHRKGAMQLMLRYQRKVNDMVERSSKAKTESSRLLRNRAKLQAATARFRDLDNHVQQEIHIIVSNDVASIVTSPTRELLLRAQLLAGQFAVDSAAHFQAKPTGPTVPSMPQHLDIAVEEKCDLQQATPTPQRRSAMIVLPPAVEDNNLYVRQSILAPPPQPQVQRAREPSATASDAEGSVGAETGDDNEVSGYETVADIHEDYGIGKRKKHVQGTRTWDIHQLIKDNMSTGQDLVECVRLPEGFARDEWIAVHVVDFFNEINLLYGTISEFCTAETCPRMSAGPCYAYAWTDATSLAQPHASGSATHLPASQYVARLMDWIERQINDPRVFPSNAAHYQSAFEHETARVILKRLFRVYAHMYHSHLEQFVELSADVHLGFCFKRFVFFVKQFDLVDDKELHALRKLVQSVLENPVDVLVGADTPET